MSMILNYKSGRIDAQVSLSSFLACMLMQADLGKQLLPKLKKVPTSLKSTPCVLRISEKQL